MLVLLQDYCHTVMANAAVSLWTACIKDLQTSTHAAGAVPASTVKALVKSLNKLEQQPPLPHAAWKKLVQDVQVNCAGMVQDGMGPNL
jgi:hypothetical protein